MPNARVVVMGHCTIDDIYQPDGRVLARTPGGAAAYATVGAAMSDTRVTLVTLLGHDYPFERLREGLSARGNVDTGPVRWLDRSSIHDVARYGADGSRVFEIEDWTAMDELTPGVEDIPLAVLDDAVVLLTPCDLDRQLELVRFLRRHGRPVAVDTEVHYFPAEPARSTLREVARHSSYFLPSIEHLQLLFDRRSADPLDYESELRALGCPWVSVKQGRTGSTLFDCAEGRHWHIPAIEDVVVEDTTGAGDAYCGGFVAGLAAHETPLDAACRGTVAASFVVESIGAGLPAHFDPALATRRYDGLCARVQREFNSS